MEIETNAASEFREVFTGLLEGPDPLVAASALAILAAHDLKDSAISETTYEVDYGAFGLCDFMDNVQRSAAELGLDAPCNYSGSGTVVDVTLCRAGRATSSWAE